MKSTEYLDTNNTGSRSTKLKAELMAKVIGQDESINDFVELYDAYTSGLNSPDHTLGNFLFLGPTGVGKTRLVEVIAGILHNGNEDILKIHCGEYQADHEISKLMGSPPGYLGHKETQPLINQEKLNAQHTSTCKISFMLFDEVEKASDKLMKLLLGVLDKAKLNLGDNNTVDMTQTFIFMTSNLGIKELFKLNQKIGYTISDSAHLEIGRDKSNGIIMSAVKKRFSPEFFNRIDKVDIFNSLDEENISQILNLELHDIKKRLHKVEEMFDFELTSKARKFIIANGFSKEYGARYLKRTIQRVVIRPLSILINSEQIQSGQLIRIDHIGGDELKFSVVKYYVNED